MTYFESILKVLVVGLRPRCGPARGLRRSDLWPTPTEPAAPRPTAPRIAPNPAMKYLGIALFVFVAG